MVSSELKSGRKSWRGSRQTRVCGCVRRHLVEHRPGPCLRLPVEAELRVDRGPLGDLHREEGLALVDPDLEVAPRPHRRGEGVDPAAAVRSGHLVPPLTGPAPAAPAAPIAVAPPGNLVETCVLQRWPRFTLRECSAPGGKQGLGGRMIRVERGVSGRCTLKLRSSSGSSFPTGSTAPISARSASSNLFDPVFYRGNYPGLQPDLPPLPVRGTMSPSARRRRCGRTRTFSPIFYLHYNPDVRGSGIPPFLHYIEIGHQEGRITKELPEILIDADQEMPPLALRRGAARAALCARRAYLLPRPLGGDRRDHRRGAARRRSPGLDHRPRCGDRRAHHPDHHRLPRGALLPLPQPRPRHPAVRASLERRAPRRLRGGRQDPHQALAAPHRRRPLAAPPDARHPALRRRLQDMLARFLAEPEAAIWWPTASTTARTNGGARTGSACAGCCSGWRSASPPTISPSRRARCTG